MTSQKQFIFSILSFVTFSGDVRGLKCYRCGTLTPSSNQPISDEPRADPYSSSSDLQPNNIFHLESCEEFQKPETPKYSYEVECGGDQSNLKDKKYCTKIVTFVDTAATNDNDEDDYSRRREKSSRVRQFTVQRGCSYAVTRSGVQHSIGCGFLYPPPPNGKLNESEHICYCDTKYCNMAHMPSKVSIACLIIPTIMISFL